MMGELAKVCRSCGGTRLERNSPTQKWCGTCGGSGYELSDAGAEIKALLIALLLDPEVRDAAVDLLLGLKREVKS
jgi:hypothetical protein